MTTITAAKSLSLRCAERNGFSTVEAFTAARREAYVRHIAWAADAKKSARSPVREEPIFILFATDADCCWVASAEEWDNARMGGNTYEDSAVYTRGLDGRIVRVAVA